MTRRKTPIERCACDPIGKVAGFNVFPSVKWSGGSSTCVQCKRAVSMAPPHSRQATLALRPPKRKTPVLAERPAFSRAGGWMLPCKACGAVVFWRGWGVEDDPNRFCDGPTDWVETDRHGDCIGVGLPVREFDAWKSELDRKNDRPRKRTGPQPKRRSR